MVDLFVIGAGSGGVRAARIAAGYGARVMIAEEYRVGGTCVIRGCVPKKLLVYASRFADEFEDAAGYGWTVPEPIFDWATLIANKDRDIARLELAYTTALERAGVAIVKSRAVLEDAHTVRLVAPATKVRAKPHPHRDWRRALESAPTFRASSTSSPRTRRSTWNALPKRILIQGGGYIAVEFAGIFNGLGSEVTLVYRGENILRGFDDDLRAHLRAEMEKRGIKIITGKTVEGHREGRRRRVPGAKLSDDSAIDVDKVMFAIGRWPNVDGLRPRSSGRAAREERRHRGRRVLADVGAAHLCDRRRHQPDQSHAGRDPRGPRLRRHRVRRQADAGRSYRRADRGVLRAGGGRDRPHRGGGLRARSPRSTSTRPRSAR